MSTTSDRIFQASSGNGAPSLAPDAQPREPMDEAFEAARRTSLEWLPALGMGRLRLRQPNGSPYDQEYWDKYVGYADTPMGRAITDARVELVARWVGRDVDIVDVGVGCGAFLEAWNSRRLPGEVSEAEGYDVNPVAVMWLRERGLFRDPRRHAAPALTFWDTLEHIADPAEFLAAARDWVFVSLPIVPGDGPPTPRWKHYRPDEHCWYWTRKGLIQWMADHGFRCIECNAMETLLGREDIESFAFQRI